MGIAESEGEQIGEIDRLRARGVELEAEIDRLRARVAELEAQLVEVEDWANRAVGSAQERLYWLDRWHLDLNALMQRPGASELRALLRAARVVYRFLRQLKLRIQGIL